WGVAGVFGGVRGGVVGAVVYGAVRSINADPRGAFLAALLAGWLWAFAPVAAGAGRTVLSDEPAALAGVACLLLTGLGLLLRSKSRWAILCAALGGLSLGLTAAMRPIAAFLLAPPLAILLIAARRPGFRALLPRLAAWV